jgi:Holliday junction resolvase RusA-like endonuclease
MKIEILGRPISKKNSKQIFRAGGRLIVAPSKAYKTFCESALLQLGKQPTIAPPYYVKYEFQMKGRLDTDIDNMIAGINDILQECGRIDDDKNIIAIEAIKVPLCKDWKTIIEIDNYAPYPDIT